MKIACAITVGALGCMAFAAVAQQQQQSPYQTPAVAGQATLGNPMLLNLSGVTVTDQSGQPLGPMQHIVLNPSSCVDLAVLSMGGEKLIPVPWQLVSGSGALRGQTELAGQSTFVMKVDRTILLQAPSLTVAQLGLLTQPQTVQQVQAFFSQHQQPSAVGGTGAQTNVAGGSLTNRPGIGGTQTNIPSPTGPTNIIPGQPPLNTNRPSIIPPGREGQPPYNQPPTTRPPTNRPPATTPGQPLQ